MAIDGQLAAVICIEDPLREEAADVIRQLRSLGLTKLVMMTGDSDRTARTIAAKVGVDGVLFRGTSRRQGKLCGEGKGSGKKCHYDWRWNQ